MAATGQVAPHAGLRERKKQLTREHIAEAARGLFAARGFDSVTVAEVARAAEVSEQTVFNHFATKEDLVYWRMQSFEAELLEAIRERPRIESVIAAFAGVVLRPRGALATDDPDALRQLRGVARMISASPALLARDQQMFAGYTASLAKLLAAEHPRQSSGQLEPWVVANALVGVHQAMVHHARELIIAGASNPRLAREVHRQGERALAALHRGLHDYGVWNSRHR